MERQNLPDLTCIPDWCDDVSALCLQFPTIITITSSSSLFLWILFSQANLSVFCHFSAGRALLDLNADTHLAENSGLEELGSQQDNCKETKSKEKTSRSLVWQNDPTRRGRGLWFRGASSQTPALPIRWAGERLGRREPRSHGGGCFYPIVKATAKVRDLGLCKHSVHPSPVPSPWQPQVCSLCLWICFCFMCVYAKSFQLCPSLWHYGL